MKSTAEILSMAQDARVVIQDFKPLSESIEWELSRAYFQERGSAAFATVADHVPFEINNDGTLSMKAAELCFSNLCTTNAIGGQSPSIHILEFGCGSGLFARFFLDAFQALCRKHNRDFYDRVCYVASDQSDRMLCDIDEKDVLSNHSGHYELVQLDALNPRAVLESIDHNGSAAPCRFAAIFANYLLDNLPASVVRIENHRLASQLCVRTCLARGAQLQEHTSLDADEIRRRAAADDSTYRRELIDLYPVFALEFDYHSVDLDRVPYNDFVEESSESTVLHSHGAIRCLEQSVQLLEHGGIILVNDYGPVTTEESSELYSHQRFSGSIAIGVNFPLLRSYFSSRGHQWVEPNEDDASLRSRLLGIAIPPETVSHFTHHFQKSEFELIRKPSRQAQAYAQHGAVEAALSEYNRALQLQPYNWVLMDEIAQILLFRLRSAEPTFQMAQAGLELNPNGSAELWNTLGDAHFCLERFEEAQKAFRKALSIDPQNVRSRLNLAHFFVQVNQLGKALQAIGDGLLLDRHNTFRERFLEIQAQILQRLEARQRMEHGFLASRVFPRITVEQADEKNDDNLQKPTGLRAKEKTFERIWNQNAKPYARLT